MLKNLLKSHLLKRLHKILNYTQKEKLIKQFFVSENNLNFALAKRF